MRDQCWAFAALVFAVVFWPLAGCQTPSRVSEPVQVVALQPLRYGSPEEALKALFEATQQRDRTQLRKIFGVEVGELASGDEVQDDADFEDFAQRLAKAADLTREGDARVILHVGPEQHPFPIPIVRDEGQWYFDTDAGKEELLNRRIGDNELNTIRVCRGYVAAQREYILKDHDGDGVMEYAQHLASTPEKHDGLYWESKPDEPLSPLGSLAAQAQGEGYGGAHADAASGPRPYHGYVYKILTRQGAHAPGGAYPYVIHGHMVAGFALVAYPIEWGSSGVMTFIVNSNGKVFEKNLGEKTTELVAKLNTYDPDSSWSVSEE